MMIEVKIRAFLLTLSVAAVTISDAAQERGSNQQKRVVLHAARLLDVKAGTTPLDQVVVIVGDKIITVGPAKWLKPTADDERIELPSATVLPGLIDCHVHLTGEPNQLDLGPGGLHISYPRRALIGARNARITLEAGFTTVRNVAADGYSDVALRDAVNEDDVPGPRILASGPALSITGGHWDENYLAPQFTFSKEGVAAVVKQVRENIKYGGDLIKVMVHRGSGLGRGQPGAGAVQSRGTKGNRGNRARSRPKGGRSRACHDGD